MYRFLKKDRKLLFLILIFLLLGIIATVVAYQNSFLPDTVIDVGESMI